jgi:uncharacterized protein (TIGR02996 family)
MTREEHFLAAIRENPDDDAVRLIFADWLEEQGDQDRAEFVRIQVERAALHEDDPRVQDLLDREQDLLAKHREVWLGGLDEIADDVVFQRGLPEKVQIKARDFEKHGERLFDGTAVREVYLTTLARRGASLAKCPWLEQVQGLELQGSGKELMAVLASPRLSNLRHLRIGCQVSGKDVAELAKAPCSQALRDPFLMFLEPEHWAAFLTWPSHSKWKSLETEESWISDTGAIALAKLDLPQLRRLKLTNTDIEAAGAVALAAAPWLSALRELELSHNYLGDGVASLLRSPYLGPLVSLDLSWTGISVAGVEALMTSAVLAGLETLRLHGQIPTEPLTAAIADASAPRLRVLSFDCATFNAEQIRRLGDTPAFPALEFLRLRGGRLNRRGIANLGRCKLASNLTRLDLGGNNIGDAGARALARSPHFNRLTWLELADNRLGPEGIEALVNSSHLAGLRRLDLRGNDIGVKGVRALAASPNMATLEELHLPWGLGDMAVRALAKSPHLGRLRRLSLLTQGIGSGGARALADSACLPSLRELDLSWGSITDEEADQIAASSWMSQLSALHLRNSRISAPALRRLRKRFGHRLHM